MFVYRNFVVLFVQTEQTTPSPNITWIYGGKMSMNYISIANIKVVAYDDTVYSIRALSRS